MPKVMRIRTSETVAVNWDDPSLVDLVAAGQPAKVRVRDPRFQEPIQRSYVPVERNEDRWGKRVTIELARKSTCAKLIRIYRATTLPEEIYNTKVRPLYTYWQMRSAFEDDCATMTGSGRAISEAFSVLGAMCFLGQSTVPNPEETNKVPLVCSLKTALQMQNSWGQSETIEGISRAHEIRMYRKTLLISEFRLEFIGYRAQRALLYLLQDREANGLLTLMHISDFDPDQVHDSELSDYLESRVKKV